MKKSLIGIMLLGAIPLAAQASCETVKADISQKIINNGVPESGFTLILCQTIRRNLAVDRLSAIAKMTRKRLFISVSMATKMRARLPLLHTDLDEELNAKGCLSQPFYI